VKERAVGYRSGTAKTGMQENNIFNKRIQTNLIVMFDRLKLVGVASTCVVRASGSMERCVPASSRWSAVWESEKSMNFERVAVGS
jgi:hypothetical protein